MVRHRSLAVLRPYPWALTFNCFAQVLRARISLLVQSVPYNMGCRIEEAKEPLRDLEADSLGKEDAALREFSSCHMTSTERLEARLGPVSKRKE
jgi:hypothetical protein